MDIYQYYIYIYISTQSSTCPSSHISLSILVYSFGNCPIYLHLTRSSTSIHVLGLSEEFFCLHKQDAAQIDFPTFHFIFNNLWRGALGILQEALGLFIPLDKLIP